MARGTKREHVCAFSRVLDEQSALVVVLRLVVGLTEGKEHPPLGAEVWKYSWLGLPKEQRSKSYRNLFTGELLHVGERHGSYGLPLSGVFARFPVALLDLRPH